MALVDKNLIVSLLGGIDVRLDGTALADGFQSKMLALLAYLAVEGRPHTREHLSELLWPDLAPDAARSNLRVTLFRLGQALGDRKYLQAPRDTVLLATTTYWLDVAEFMQPLNADMSCAEMESRLALYRGALLDGLTLACLPDYWDWLCVKRAACQRQALALLDMLIAALEKRGDIKAALHHTARYLELDPWSEHGHRKMMRLLAQDGQEAAALAQYALCKKVLEQELGTPPTAQTVELCERIKAGKLRPEAVKPYPFAFQEQVADTATGKPLNVLIVDDHLLFRAGLTLMLNELGPKVTVREAASCEEALAQPLADRDFDVILLDLKLPGMSGIDGLALFRKRYPDTPVILFSGDEDMAMIRAAHQAGARGYLSKAMNACATMNAITQVLDGGAAFPFDFVGVS